MEHVKQFLSEFVSKVAHKARQLNKAVWILETTGSPDAADLKAELDTELRMLFNDRAIYDKLLKWDQEIQEPLLKRQLNVLIRAFKPNLIPQALLEEIAQKEAELSQSYANFRPEFEGKALSENEVRAVLKKENKAERRKKVWEASKEIGDVLAPQILHLVQLRNQAAHSLGYSDYFQMQLDLQEVNGKWLLQTFDELSKRSDEAYLEMLQKIEKEQSKRFGVEVKALGPWAWSDPFCQEDPLNNQELDDLVSQLDFSKAGQAFYERMGIPVHPILERSDMFERPGKSQHAFCINIDREKDVRTLNNVQPSIRWLETVLHELGHAIYELGFDSALPWLLREPPHMITTEAMALLAGRQAYRYDSLSHMIEPSEKTEPLMKKADQSLTRRQLIFSRWVLVMTEFESQLYSNPKQDLNGLWWKLVEKYQKIKAPQGRQSKSDWAAKYHIGLAPVYYFSYLLGEMFASSIEESLSKASGSQSLDSHKAGQFLQHKLFFPGNRMPWDALVQHVTGYPLTPDAWLTQFAGPAELGAQG
jgi:peptidyl-dipeptidase A